MRLSTLLLCILGLTGVWSQCVQDYECGNVPYTICDGGVNDCPTTVPGLGIDTTTNEVYFAQVCRDEFHQFPNITFKKLAAAGGVPTIVQTRKQIPAAANPGIVFDVVSSLFFYSIQSRSPSQILTTLNLISLEETRGINTERFFQNILELDSANSKSYVANIVFTNESYYYDIRGFNGILGRDRDSLVNNTLYIVDIPSIPTSIRARGNDLFWTVATPDEAYTTYSTTLYKGSTDGSANAAAQFTLANARIQDFDVSADRVYYGTQSGVYSSDFSGNNVKHISWGSGATGVRILNGRVYWNTGVAILSDSLDGDDVKQVNGFDGSCKCRKGFTGADCSTCTGQIQWLEGVPACINIGEDGNPDTCNYDYECSDSPYRFCSTTCQCRYGLTGDHCNQCQNTTQSLTWVNGYPTCQ